VELVVGTLTLHYTYHGTDILWMYTVLIAASPLVFHLLMTGRTAHLVAGSILLWLVYQIFPMQATIPWVVDNAVYFPIAAWQLYFVAGLVLGYHREPIRAWLSPVPRWPALIISSVAFAGLIALDWSHETGRLASWPVLKWLAGDLWLEVFDKPSVAWGRVLAFAIAAPFFYLLVDRLWRPIVAISGHLLLPLGSAALLSYGVHLVVIVVVYNLAGEELGPATRLANTIFQAMAVLLVWLTIQVWQRVPSLEAYAHTWLDAAHRRAAPRFAAVALAAAIVLPVALVSALLVGPVQAVRTAPSVDEAVEAAGTLVSDPPAQAAETLPTALIVLHDAGRDGPRTARPLVAGASQAGWAVVAPSLGLSRWESPDDARVAASELVPEIVELIRNIDEHVGYPAAPRVLLYGEGVGAELAYLVALLHPELVEAVVLARDIPCTLPLESDPFSGDILEFPAGIADAEAYRGQEFIGRPHEGLRIGFINPISAEHIAADACAWAGAPVPAEVQLGRVVASLEDVGASVQVRAAGTRTDAVPMLQALLDS
jgi:hypothetical protein